MRILIIRHGDPDYEHDSLTEKGKREAQLLAEKLKNEKIDYFYSSPLGRARLTCRYVAEAHGKDSEVVVYPWLQEFGHTYTMPDGEVRHHIWDMLPEEWTDNKPLYDVGEWQQVDFFGKESIQKSYGSVVEPLDELLKKHGYMRTGRYYQTEQGNHDTIAIFCHFGLEMILLSHLLNISPVSLTHHFTALTSSVTTLYTEERRKGKAIFRCCGFGDIGHLYMGGEEPSFAARFCEVYEDETRHD